MRFENPSVADEYPLKVFIFENVLIFSFELILEAKDPS
jgi:hypothetical protein